MFQLENASLRVSLLDPIADRSKLGSRYCTGGYIWQVTDLQKGELLSGPQYPNPPKVFDGQGLPEVFEIPLGPHRAKVGEDVFVIGVGRVKRESPHSPFHVRLNPTVTEFTTWKIENTPSVSSMSSHETFQEWELDLRRTVTLEGRSVTSKTSVKNLSKVELPVRWFAHPFFPHAGLVSTRFSHECSFPPYHFSGGYKINSEGWLEREPNVDWTKGNFQLVDLPFGYPLEAYQKHPLIGEVKVECRFPVVRMPIWGNDRTISFEPYYHTMLQVGAATEWSIVYHF